MKTSACLFLFVVTCVSLFAEPALPPGVTISVLKAKAAQGDAESELELGRLYHLGKGVPKDLVKAGELYRKAADQGNAKAMYNLGYLSEQGEGVPVDDEMASQWFRKSADKGLPAGQLKVGELYYFGDEGQPKDYVEAKKWLLLAAQQKDAPVQAGTASGLLGWLYEHGWGVPADKAQALPWYTKGAELGDAKAQSSLGRIYVEGTPLKKDSVLSYKWLKLAASQGDIFALHLMPEYMSAKVYSVADIAEGNRLVDEYREKHHQPPLGTIKYPMDPTIPGSVSLPPPHAPPPVPDASKATVPAAAPVTNASSTEKN